MQLYRESMAHWFHRNPFKATATLNFDLGQTSTSAKQICRDTQQARAHLLEIFPNPSHNVSEVKTASEKYVSYLEGFINSVDDSQANTKQNTSSQGFHEASGADGAKSSNEDSKLRNSLKVTWTNSLGGKSISQFDFIFEEISMLINVALWLTKHAAKLAASSAEISEDEAKEVHRSLREAAGIFKFIQDKMLNKLYEIPGDCCDLDQRVLCAYELQCTAEAQEVTIARAIELKHSSSLISSLALETSNIFTKADDALKSIEETYIMKWRKYFQFKRAFYLSYAHCYNGKTLLGKDKGGAAVRSLKESLLLFQKSEELAREYAKTKGSGTVAKPQQHPFFLRLEPIVHRILEKTERENSMIYHDKVPEELPGIESKVMFGLANPVEYQLPACSPEWSPAVYKSFITKSLNKKLDEKGDAVKPVKELPIDPTEKHPGNTTGCIVT